MKPYKEIREQMNPIIRKLFPVFSELSNGDQFLAGGRTYQKVSRRTARIVAPVEYNTRWFYFGQNDRVIKL